MRDRLVMPILVPVGALAAIGLLIFCMGKILLAVEAHYATTIAIVVSVLILAVCSIVAAMPRMQAQQLSMLAGVPVAVVIGVGLYLAVRPGAGGHGGAAAVTNITQVATDNVFSVTAVTGPVNTEITLTLDNRCVALHNWLVTNGRDKDGNEIKTELLAGGRSETITFTIGTTGAFDFICDVHPVEMKGTMTVVEAETGGGHGEGAARAGGGAAGTAIVGTDNKFNPADITVKANEEAVVTFDNKGAAVHNWHVLNVKSTDGKDVTTQLLPGGQREVIRFTIDRPGTYDVQCDVHPVDMRGKLTVQ